MAIGLLAPVPAVHLKAALDTCTAAGRVAFGTEAFDVFHKAMTEYGAGIPVLIWPTAHFGDPDNLCDPGYGRFRGTLVGTVEARVGRHPNPAVRPATTISGNRPDGRWSMFWEVSDLVRLSDAERVAITALATEAGKPLAKGFVPHGPTLVKASVL